MLAGLAIVAGVVAFALGHRHTLHMFQQSSYQYPSYFRYLLTHKGITFFPAFGIVCVILSLLAGENQGLLNAALVCMIIFSVSLCVLYRPRVAKKKLVFTPRVKRLTTAVVCLYLIASVIVLLLPGDKAFHFALWTSVAAMLSPYCTLLGNVINTPIEKRINLYYVNDAKKMLKACPDLKIIGITGSYGKTSVKYYLQTLLSEGFEVLMTPESYNTPMGVVKTIRGSLKSTTEIFICEMGARHVGDIKEICDIVDPGFGCITSLGYQHLETFKSLENIVGTKKELFDALPANGPRFINGDNEYVRQFKVNEGAITYGMMEDNDYRATEIRYSQKGTTFVVNAPDGSSAEFVTKLLGEHNVVNITGAIAIAHEFGLPLEKLKLAVRRLEGAPHRLMPIVKGKNIVIDDAYNSNPNGASMALKTLKKFEGVRVLVTPGMVELGEKEDYYNYEFGKEAATSCDYIALVGKKQTTSIAKGVTEAGFDSSKLCIADNLQEAMQFVYGIQTTEQLVILLENDLPDNY